MEKIISVRKRYLNLPVKNNAEKCIMRFFSDGRCVREFKIELTGETPDFWAIADLNEFMGREILIKTEGLDHDSALLEALVQSDTIEGGEELYHEKFRPQFHFSSKRGWLNDPNGLTYYKGEYHLFYQHNPYGRDWDNIHWGHAVSTDLVHWEELGEALCPDDSGMIFSGSGVIDRNNTAEFQNGDEEVMILIYTAAGGTSELSKGKLFTQCIAYSNDRGRTWKKYEKNPVLGHIVNENRDPKVIWHEQTRQWIMALYLDNNDFALYSSPNLREWQKVSELQLPDCSECPDIFELPVDGNTADKKWVFMGANSTYIVGSFDGNSFMQESTVLRSNSGNHFYAPQTWSNIPQEDGRRIQIGWATGDKSDMLFHGMPFNRFMTFPCELTLRTTEDGIRLFTYPVKEIMNLYDKKYYFKDLLLSEGEKILDEICGGLYDITCEMDARSAEEVSLVIRGVPVIYNVREMKLRCADRETVLKPANGKIYLRILADKVSIEIFGNEGRVYMPMGVMTEDNRPVTVISGGGETCFNSLEICTLKSIWDR